MIVQLIMMAMSIDRTKQYACPGDTQCRECASSTVCNVCIDGFWTNNQCSTDISSISNCDHYATKDSCLMCELGYYLKSSSSCKSCSVSNCALCDAAGRCNACFGGVLTDGASCDSKFGTCADVNCDVCNPKEFCTSCKTGFALDNNGACTKVAVENCKRWDGKACVSCGYGYYLATDSTCVLAPTRATSSHWFLWLLVILIILVLIGLIVYFAMKKNQGGDAYAKTDA